MVCPSLLFLDTGGLCGILSRLFKQDLEKQELKALSPPFSTKSGFYDNVPFVASGPSLSLPLELTVQGVVSCIPTV